jgi:hypothetical protein
MQVVNREAIEEARIVAWRRDQLTGAGFSLPLAVVIADDERYDLHALTGLTERGCAPALAVRILAPLEERGVA